MIALGQHSQKASHSVQHFPNAYILLAQASSMGKAQSQYGRGTIHWAVIQGDVIHWGTTVTILHRRREEITNQTSLVHILCLLSSNFVLLCSSYLQPCVCCLPWVQGNGPRQHLGQHAHP